jgi:hypothetical protein
MLVKEGKMPRPITIPGHERLVRYDFNAVRVAWEELWAAAQEDDVDEWAE